MRLIGGHNATAFLLDSSVDIKKNSNVFKFQKVRKSFVYLSNIFKFLKVTSSFINLSNVFLNPKRIQ